MSYNMTREGNDKKVPTGRYNSAFSSSEENENGKSWGRVHLQEKGHPEIKTSAENVDNGNEDVSDDVDLSCGLGPFRTTIFGTKFANLYVFAVCFGLSHLFTSMIYQVIHVQLTSLERQFNIDNARAGLFDTAARAGFISTVLFAGHFAKKSHIPLFIGISGAAQGIVLMIPAIFQLSDPYELPLLTSSKIGGNSSNSTDLGENAKYLCEHHSLVTNGTNDTLTSRHNETEVNRVAYIVILVVQAAKGVTDTFHNGFLPTLYIDDNLLDKSKMSIFLGIMHVIGELASPIGKQINGILTEVPIDLKETDMDPKDRRFVAAWWLAFLIFGAGTALFSFPIMLFPRKLISSRQRKAALNKAVVTFAGGQVEDEIAEPLEEEGQVVVKSDTGTDNITNFSAVIPAPDSGLPEDNGRRYSLNSSQGHRKRSVVSLGSHSNTSSRRPSLFPPITGPTERRVSITGDMVFNEQVDKKAADKKESLLDLLKDFPKALIRVARKPVFLLLLIDIAIIAVPLSGTSIFRNVYMANEYNVPMSDVALISGVTSAVGHITGTVAASWLSTKVTTKLGYMWIISASYLMTCGIIPVYFILDCPNEPVYGDTGQIGIPLNVTSDCDCASSQQLISCGDDDRNYYSPCYAGCTGVDGKLFTDCTFLANTTKGTTVTPGLCDTDCYTNFIIYSILHGLQYVFSSFAMVPRRLLILRIVDPQDRGFATSLYMFCYVIIAIPSPNLFGSVIDGTCFIWDDDYCALYDRDAIRYLMCGIDIGVHGCVQITFILMLILIKWEEVQTKRKLKREEEEKAAANGETLGGPV